jgi:adenosylcobinamide kinase / adenosylcobinamide-phosphate guanylyltransferase
MSSKANSALILVTGGVRSGKSTFAEQLAEQSGKKVLYLATARVEDDEMRERVALHQARRPANVRTVEEALEPHLVLKKEGDAATIILVDCLTLLVTNHLMKHLDLHGAVRKGEDIFADETVLDAASDSTLDYIRIFAAAAENCPADVVIVTNEVGMGVVPNYPLGRVFRDLSGRANQVVAAAADQVWMVVCGIPQRFK